VKKGLIEFFWNRGKTVSSDSGVIFDYVYPFNPSCDTNPSKQYALWLNSDTGEVFVCTDNTPGKNVWKGQLGTVIAFSEVTAFDVLGDGSAVALFQLDGDTNDTGGNYNGTWKGTEQYDVGKFGQAAKFDGSSYISFSPIDLANKSFTLSCWIKVTTVKDGNYFLGSVLGSTVTSSNLYVGFRNTTTFSVAFYSNDVNIPLNENDFTDDFHHFVVVYDSSTKESKLYVDGKFVASGTHPYGDYKGSLDVIGAAGGYRFAGLVDQVRVFNRVLSDSEIQQLFNES
jgi:hypothetical protein